MRSYKLNRIFLVGNITGDIYYDRLRIKGAERPFLRLILMSSRPRYIGGMRVVLWDEKAELFFPYLQRGSEIAAVGLLQTREHKDKLIHEIEATNLILLRHINWEFGEQERLRRDLPKPTVTANNVFVAGTIGTDIYFDWFKHSSGEGMYAFLRVILTNEQYLSGLRVTVRGALAELAFPFIQGGSKIAVDGHLQTRDRETGKKVVEVVAEHIAFLENINWAAGEAAQKSRTDQQQIEVVN
jgi:single-stranded DNA-binding protein